MLMRFYVFMHVIPFAELLSVLFGINAKIPLILGVILSLGILLSGQITRFWTVGAAKIWMLVLFLYLVASATGQYPGRSLPFIAEYGLRFHVFPFLICAVAQTGAQLRGLMTWAAGAGVVLLAVCTVYGTTMDGRFVVPNTSLLNPNDLALLLMLASGFVLSLAYSNSAFLRMVAFAGLPLCVYFILKTGSRANFVTIIVLALVALIVAPKKTKVIMLAGTPLLMIAMVFILPSSTWDRLTNIVLDPVAAIRENSDNRFASGSQLARTELQKRAIELTLQHPLLGVGPQMFADAVDEMVRNDTGQKSGWQNAHNVYLQISAENGIPAALLYIGMVFWTIRTNYRTHKLSRSLPALDSYVGQSFCLLLITLGLAIGLLFGNYAYHPLLALMIGLTAANALAIRQDPAANTTAPPAARFPAAGF